MIGCIDVYCSANNPQIKLTDITQYTQSPSNLRIFDVPDDIGKWKIKKIIVQVIYPNNLIKQYEAKKVLEYWVCTIDACDTEGKSENGVIISASGTDENGIYRESYVLGIADLYILKSDCITVQIAGTSYILRLHNTKPEVPNEGDVYKDGDTYKVYSNGQWDDLGGGGGSLEGYATEQWVLDKHYLTQHQPLDNYATKDDAKQLVKEGVEYIEHVHIPENFLVINVDYFGYPDDALYPNDFGGFFKLEKVSDILYKSVCYFSWDTETWYYSQEEFEKAGESIDEMEYYELKFEDNTWVLYDMYGEEVDDYYELVKPFEEYDDIDEEYYTDNYGFTQLLKYNSTIDYDKDPVNQINRLGSYHDTSMTGTTVDGNTFSFEILTR